jgi:cobalt/nickel transport system ATP-binding protein
MSMDENRHLIRLENISYHYPGGEPVLKDLSFHLRENERIGVIGPNGSGKTTFFHIIMGLLKPSSGRIELFGREMRDEKNFRTVRQKIGMLFQDADDQLFSPTVLEDVAFGPLNLGKTVPEAKKIATENLKKLGLQGFEDRITHKLSGGEKKLVALATVLAMEPKVLLLDEPTTGLDLETTERITAILKAIHVSCIFISHNMDFIHQTTDKVYGMAKGRILVDEERVPHPHIHSHDCGQLPHTHDHHPPEEEPPKSSEP